MADELEEELERYLRERYRRPGRVIVPRPRFVGGSGSNVTINLAPGQSSPVSVSPINFTVTFSQPALGFTASDISFVGSSAPGTLSAVVTGTDPYNVAVSGMTGPGNVIINIPAGAATDLAGKPFPAAISYAFVRFEPWTSLLLETGEFLLLETGDLLLME